MIVNGRHYFCSYLCLFLSCGFFFQWRETLDLEFLSILWYSKNQLILLPNIWPCLYGSLTLVVFQAPSHQSQNPHLHKNRGRKYSEKKNSEGKIRTGRPLISYCHGAKLSQHKGYSCNLLPIDNRLEQWHVSSIQRHAVLCKNNCEHICCRLWPNS